MNVKKKTKMNLGVRGKVAALFVVMAVLLSAGVAVVAYSISYRQVSSYYMTLALDAARTSATLVNGDNIDRYLSDGIDDEYTADYNKLKDFKTIFGFTYLYIIRPETDINNCIYIFDIYTDMNDTELIAELGEETGEDEVYELVLDVFLTGNTEDTAVVTNTEYGWLASAYAPVYKTDGSITAVVGADISMDKIMSSIMLQTVQLLLITVAIIIVFSLLLLIIISRSILRPVINLSHHMEDFDADKGNLEEFEVPGTGDEIQVMAEKFNRMVVDIGLYMKNLAAVTADRERIATELDVATKIQASMLPSIFPPYPDKDEFELYASMLPAKEVGGDFYDFFLVDDNTLAVVMADVSGKGVPAALFMVIAKTLIKNNAQSASKGGAPGKNPGEVFEAVNNILCENNDAFMFVTAFMGYLDIPTGKFTYVNAGHNPPLVKLGENFDWLRDKSGPLLAGRPGKKYTPFELTFSKGDEIYLYTDGVTEAVNNELELFDEARLLEVVNANKGLQLSEFLKVIKQEIDKFADGAEQADDITMLALRFRG